MTLEYGSLFSGVGGFDLGFDRAGMRCAWQVEKDEKARAVLSKHWPDVIKYEDVRNVGKQNLATVDVVCGGFPCQPHSLAGERKASEDERDLWEEFARIVCEIRPRWVVAENVPGLLSSESGEYFGKVLRDLASCGYDAEWQVLSAAAFGAPHLRERVFIVAYSSGFHGKPNRSFFGREASAGIRAGWKPEPALVRVADGFPGRVDQLRQLGNAVVPQIPEWIGRRIIEAEAS